MIKKIFSFSLLMMFAFIGLLVFHHQTVHAALLITVEPTSITLTQDFEATDADGYGMFNGAGMPFNKVLVDGKVAFCIEPAYLVGDGAGYTRSESSYSEEQKDVISKIIYHGFDNTHQTDADYVVTQATIWEYIAPFQNTTLSGIDGSGVADMRGKITALMSKVKQHDFAPSFKDQTVTLRGNESIHLVDTNDTLKVSDIVDSGGLEILSSENQLIVKALPSSPTSTSIVIKKFSNIISDSYSSPIIYGHLDSQDVGYGGNPDPILSRVYFKVIKFDQVQVLKTNELGGKESGVVYGLYSDSGATQLIKQATTDGEGLADFGEVELALGKVYVKEISAPSHLVLSNEIKEVVLVGGQTHSVSFRNDFVREEIEVVKTNENGQPEANVVYGLYSDPQTTNKLQEVTTNGQGQATFSNVSVGLDTVYVKEISAPSHLVLSDEVKAVKLTAGKEHNVSFTNTFVRVNVNLIKTNENGQPEANVVYGLYSDPQATNKLQEVTTNGQGQATFSNVSVGLDTVYVKEISAPSHLVLSDEIKAVKLTAGKEHNVSFTNTFVRVNVNLTKTNENGQPEANVVYGLYSDPQATNKLQEVTTNGQGQATFSNVSVGLDTVYVKEISAPSHLVLSDEVKAVKLTAGKEHNVSFTNTFVRVDIDVIKVNDEGNAEKGVVIGLYSDPQATNKLQEVTTDENGLAQFTQMSVDLKKVYAKEISVPPHLVLNTEVKEIQLVPNETHSVTFVNKQVRGRIQIVKVDANNEEMPIENAVFGVYRAGTMELIETIKSDRDGFAYSSLLKYGDYFIQELEAPVEYYLNPNRYPVSIRDHGKTVVQYIGNDQVLVKLQVIKTDQETAERLAGVVFEIRNKATQEVVEFEYLNDTYEVVKQTQLVTNQNGEAFTRGFLKYGEYQLVEVKAKAGYLTIKPIDFVINRDTETVNLNIIGSTKVQPISNTKTTTEISKQDVYGKVLSGATLKLVDKATGEEIATWVSSDTAMVIRGLAFDKTYTLIEVKAPEGYFVAEPVDFTINPLGLVTKVVMEDEKIPTIHTLAQVNDEKVIEAVGTLTLTDKVFYKDLIVGKEYEAKLVWMDKLTGNPFLVDGQPLTVTKLFTPTTTEGEVVLSVEVEAKHFVKTVSLVAFEDLFKEGKQLVSHANIHDVDQTIKILKPTIQSKAMVLPFDPTNLKLVTVKETVNFGELRAGLTYTNKAYVFDTATGKALLNDEGKPIVVITDFVPKTDTHEIEVLFELPIELLKKGNLVVVDDLYLNDLLVATHHDLENKDQTVSFVEVKIRKVDSQDKTKVLKEAEFTVYQNGVAIKTVQTDENGLAVFVLPEGTYALKETKAPDNYQLYNIDKELDLTKFDELFSHVISFPNEPIPPLEFPNLGMLQNISWVLIGSFFIVSAIILLKKEKK